jgi:hypothetical protein
MPTRHTLSRRSALQAAILALLGQAAAAGKRAAKASKASAAYQDEPRGIATCGSCASFAPPKACKTVEGEVSPHGWCKLYIGAD